MDRRKVVALTITIMTAVGMAEARNRTAANFLSINPSPEYAALGITGTALVNDSYSSFINPSGLARAESTEIAAAHTELFFDSTYNFFGFARPLSNERGTVGASAVYARRGKLERRSETGEKQGSFTSDDLALSLSYGRRFGKRFSSGMSVKTIRQRIESYSAEAIAVDLGGQFALPVRGLKIGAAVTNAGSKLRFHEQSERLPTAASLGLAYERNLFVVSGDVENRAGRNRLGVGAMFYPTQTFALRCGYSFLSDRTKRGETETDLSRLAGMAAGIGFFFGRYQMDYALVPHEELSPSHRFSVLMRFQ